jgi:hypothetical protein
LAFSFVFWQNIYGELKVKLIDLYLFFCVFVAKDCIGMADPFKLKRQIEKERAEAAKHLYTQSNIENNKGL